MRMQLASLATAILAVAASPSPAKKELDWKYAVGWDGVTLPASTIGEAVSTGNDTSLEVSDSAHKLISTCCDKFSSQETYCRRRVHLHGHQLGWEMRLRCSTNRDMYQAWWRLEPPDLKLWA